MTTAILDLPATGARHRATVARRISWPLAAILAVQSAISLTLVWSNTVFADEALYLWAGHLEIAHWLHGYPLPANQKSFGSYFSGAPQLYPPIGATADAVGGIYAARILGLLFMLAATVFLYLTARAMVGRNAALVATALFGISEPCLRLAFATYDPMAVMLIACATWVGTQAACKWRGELVAAAALLLALGSAIAYSYVIYIPVIALALCLFWRRTFGTKAAVVCTAWLTGTTLFMFGSILTLLHVWAGFLSEIVARSGGGSGIESVLRAAWAFAAVIVVLAAIGAALAWTRDRGVAPLLIVLTLAAVLVPVEQVRAETGTSLDKHMSIGLWLAAIAAGYAVTQLVRLGSRQQIIAVAAIALTLPLVSGWQQAYATYHLWPNTSQFTPALEKAEAARPGLVLIEHPAWGLRNVAEYSTPLGHDWKAWGDVSWNPVFVPQSTWRSYYAGQIITQKFAVIALFFPLAKSAISAPQARQFLNGSSKLRQELLRLITYNPQVPGMYALAQAIEDNRAYSIADIIPYDGTSSGDYVIWERTA